jgi:steroid delta-isomerase-like uncharacterized protein
MLETNKAAVCRYYEEIWNRGNLRLIDELFAPEYANHDPATPGVTIHGREAFKGLVNSYREAMPDRHFTIEEQIAEGDRVVSRWTATGTLTQEMMTPLGPLPATGKSATVSGITITTFTNGKIVDDHVIWDTLGWLQQVGAVPPV